MVVLSTWQSLYIPCRQVQKQRSAPGKVDVHHRFRYPRRPESCGWVGLFGGETAVTL